MLLPPTFSLSSRLTFIFHCVSKKKHITNVRKEIKAKKPNLELSRSSILLIDDDLKNIDAALNDGYKAIGFNPYNPEQLLEDMMNLSSSCT